MDNIHIPKGMSLTDYVAEALTNAKENGDAAFLHSLEVTDVDGIFYDMQAYDAGVETYLENALDYADAEAQVKLAIEEWVTKRC